MSDEYENLFIIRLKCHSFQNILAFPQMIILMKYIVSQYSLPLIKIKTPWHAFMRVCLYIYLKKGNLIVDVFVD